MPAIYRIQCPGCGPEKDQMILDGHLALKRDTGEFTALRHPGENFDLEKLGYTEEKALREARLFGVRYKLCTDCGSLHAEREYRFLVGCQAPLIAGILMLLIAITFIRMPLSLALGSASLITAVTFIVTN